MRHRSRFLSVFAAIACSAVTAMGESVARFPDAVPAPPSAASPAPSAAAPSASPRPEVPSDAPIRPPELPISGADELLNRGRALEASGHYTEAIRAYTDSIRLAPGKGLALLTLGKLRARIGDLNEAELLLFTTASRSQEVAAEALTERAHVRKAERRDAEALHDLSAAAELVPDDAARTAELAGWYVAQRAWLPALELYRRVVSEVTVPELVQSARRQVRALGILAAELDPVRAGEGKSYGFTRRALAKLSSR